MAKVYLAAPYAERPEQLVVASVFMERGHKITSRWILGSEDVDALHEYTYYAKTAIEDIKNADWLVVRSFDRGTSTTGGGRHFEFGLAYALGKKCIIVGGQEHVFCHLPDVMKAKTYDEALLYIAKCEV